MIQLFNPALLFIINSWCFAATASYQCDLAADPGCAFDISSQLQVHTYMAIVNPKRINKGGDTHNQTYLLQSVFNKLVIKGYISMPISKFHMFLMESMEG